MGTLQEVTIVRKSDGYAFAGQAWMRDDGTFEAWWYEDDIRHTYPFSLNGRQLSAAINNYELKLQNLPTCQS